MKLYFKSNDGGWNYFQWQLEIPNRIIIVNDKWYKYYYIIVMEVAIASNGHWEITIILQYQNLEFIDIIHL